MTKNINESDHTDLINAALADGSWRGLAIALTAVTGARINEVLRVTESQIQIQNGIPVIEIKASKNGRDRLIPLPGLFLTRVKSLRAALRERRRGAMVAWLCNDSSESVATAYHLLLRDFKRMQMGLWGEAKYTTHSFRHTVATLALQNGISILKVKAILGHRNIQNTMFYVEAFENSLTLDDLPGIMPRGITEITEITETSEIKETVA